MHVMHKLLIYIYTHIPAYTLNKQVVPYIYIYAHVWMDIYIYIRYVYA